MVAAPDTASDTPMVEGLLAIHSLVLAELRSMLEWDGRPALLTHLKERGVAKLPERQQIARAVAKLVREAALPPRATCAPLPHEPPPEGCRAWAHWDGGWLPVRAPLDSEPLPPPPPVVVIDDVLTRTECAALAIGKESHAARLSDGGLAAEVFARILHKLPPTAAQGWSPAAGVWERLRVASSSEPPEPARASELPQCEVGQSQVLPLCRSFYSLLIFLEDSSDGGGAVRIAEQGAIADVVPWAGRAVLLPEGKAHTRTPTHAPLRHLHGAVLYYQSFAGLISPDEPPLPARAECLPPPRDPPTGPCGAWLHWTVSSQWQPVRAPPALPAPSDGGSTAPVAPTAPVVDGANAAESVIVLDDVLSAAECARLGRRAAGFGYERSKLSGRLNEDFRRGGRAALNDGGLAREIFERIAHRLPRTAAGSLSSLGTSAAAWGPAAGVWEQLRVLEYCAGDFFLPHRDHACEVGQSQVLPLCRSFYSLLVYLEDADDGGGATRFYLRSTNSLGAEARGGSDEATNAPASAGHLAMRTHERPSGDGCVIADVVPRAGRAVVFPHRLLHESMPIAHGGRKLVVRGDVLYYQQGARCELHVGAADVPAPAVAACAPMPGQVPPASSMDFLAAAAARAADAAPSPPLYYT